MDKQVLRLVNDQMRAVHSKLGIKPIPVATEAEWTRWMDEGKANE